MSELMIATFSAVVGGFMGMLFSLFLPKMIFDPKLKILGVTRHGTQMFLMVVNNGRMAAVDAIGRVTIRRIEEADVGVTRAQVAEARRNPDPLQDWRRTMDSRLRAEEWQTGIETNGLFWAFGGLPRLDINPGLPEALVLGYSEGEWIDIASENPRVKRARLQVPDGKTYYGEVIVGAANCRLSNIFRFQIRLGPEQTAIIEPYNGRLPQPQ